MTWTLPFGMLGLQPVLDPFPHGRRPRRCGRHQIVILREPAGHAVVHDDSVLGAHHAVADATDVELGPLVDVDQVEQLGNIGASQIELAERRDVDDSDLGANVEHFSVGVAVVIGPDPLAGHKGHWHHLPRARVASAR